MTPDGVLAYLEEMEPDPPRDPLEPPPPLAESGAESLMLPLQACLGGEGGPPLGVAEAVLRTVGSLSVESPWVSIHLPWRENGVTFWALSEPAVWVG